MNSIVHFINFRTTPKENIFAKLNRLLIAAGINEIVGKKDLVAVKLHFGERGNMAFINPIYLQQIVEQIKLIKGIPFLTDANTLYAGTRSDAPSHLLTATQNGFSFSVVGAPLIIADGLRGRSEVAVPINQKNFKNAYIASEIVNADSLISVAHFKGHELSGFGGAIKNIGMGCASRRGKMDQHSNLSPKVTRKKCVGCGDCTTHCSQTAIELTDKKAIINADLCIGCGECILICPNSAIKIRWNQSIPTFLENMVEYTLGALKNKGKKSLFINFIKDVSPACDCHSHNDTPVVRDIGILASTDPVAIDQASVDLVNKEAALPGSCLTQNIKPMEDKFKGLYPKVEWEIQLNYAQELGIGSKQYTLEEL